MTRLTLLLDLDGGALDGVHARNTLGADRTTMAIDGDLFARLPQLEFEP